MFMNEFLNGSIYRLMNKWKMCLELNRKDHHHTGGAWFLNLQWMILPSRYRGILPSKYLQRKLRRKFERLLWKGLANATLMVKLKLLMLSFLNFYPKEVLEVNLNFSGVFFYRWSTGQNVPEFLVLPENPVRSYQHLNPHSGCLVWTLQIQAVRLKAGFEFSWYSVIYLFGY